MDPFSHPRTSRTGGATRTASRTTANRSQYRGVVGGRATHGVHAVAKPATNGSRQATHHPQSTGDGRLPVERVFVIGLVALLIATLLSADNLRRDTEQKPFGWERDAWLTLWKPIQSTSHFLLLDRPGSIVDGITGHGGGASDFVFPAEAATETPPADTASPQPADQVSSVSTATPTPTPEEVHLRTPTTADPLKMWVGGDSLVQAFGELLTESASNSGYFDVDLDYRISTGLTRPDYFNWPAHLDEVMSETNYEVVVIMYGGNDSQGIQAADGTVYEPLSDGWRDEYRRRVGGTMDLLRAQGRMVVWVGAPIMPTAGFSERMADLNRIYEEEASKRPWVEYFDSWHLFTDSNGAHTMYRTLDNGDVVTLRQEDGIHFTAAGGGILADAVLEFIREKAGLDTG